MRVDILASGSGGNCIAIRSNETTILVDVGIAKTKIEKKLLEVGIRPNHIAAIFITHAHSDHIKGLPLANKYKIPVYAAVQEWKSINGVDEDLQGIKRPGKFMDINGFLVGAFRTHHDAYEPLGYTVQTEEGKKVSICLDTGQVDTEILAAMRDSDIYIIEANHEPKMVQASDYPTSVKTRILSHIGHLSNQQTAEALTTLIQGRKEKIYLTHLSSKNNMSTLAEMTVMRALMKKGLRKDKDFEIEVV
ncbi:MBL fold metallo-hydrolase [Heyndrickxia oleronia]|jgi:phosphoribosyl 1,2-cyclic phosphodiesterase|uniref:MBL fold metallo-hydrolase n=1 Tax=Heyndrickxia oleronia TaxID=38875 RepID=UPI0024309334|nr:MBL fold metallo-hydrolase [Heyndrickxia oleronia]MCI1592468.1 MBL fold metallo-hydrolase [Heyndrickxia oleronia]MCI1615429.1 MBL fold metallo-hydrolase [Heyndrickxia oleronia]MCI1746283.1 MBL fold metallo-hydrolase [Heyndrickxia oleronia]MCI1763604.1 MBL fold metallo-hydrolase [Heyndrickxia oleronia]